MKRCDNCNVDIMGERVRCPLCQHSLTGEAEGSTSVFPYIPSLQQQFGLLFKIITLSAIACCVLSIAINMMIPQSGWWSFFVVAGIACLFVSTIFAISKANNPPKNIIYQGTIIIISCLVWDICINWHGWSLDYAIPVVAVSMLISLVITSIVLKISIDDMIFYWIIGAGYGLVPIIFVFTSSLRVIYPSIVCGALSIILAASLIVFRGKHVNSELKKRFHM